MPFGPVMSPSIALSLLKAQLSRRKIDCRIRYFTIRFAEVIGESLYSSIATDSGRPSIRELAGEWIFSGALFGDSDEAEEAYVEEILRKRRAWTNERALPEGVIARLRSARRRVPRFLDECVESIAAEPARIIGFTSVFQQHVASLALAKRIKSLLPEAVIVFGGANCEGIMGAETVRQFSFVDAAVSGEGDLVFPELVSRILRGESIDDLPGVRTKTETHDAALTTAPMVSSMDELPIPDYAEFFDQFSHSRFDRDWQPGIFFETSRGCWWGEKMHCTFCGLNGMTMRFRSKSPQRALDELTTLVRRHPGCDVQLTDNILDHRYLRTFIPALAERKLDVELFYETKSNLKKDDVRALRAAGIRRIQPGIESFSDSVLTLMRKGVSGLQNIQLLKWCREVGLTPYWNFLWGFPGEDPREYERMASLVPLLTHLTPPVGFSGIRLDRFSPNFNEAERLGFASVQPLAPYSHIYPFAPETIANLAYYFSFDYREPRDVTAYVAPLIAELRRWKRVHARSALSYIDRGDRLIVSDTRPVARKKQIVLSGVEREIYLACDAATDERILRDRFGDVRTTINTLVKMRVMIVDRNRVLALATRREVNAQHVRLRPQASLEASNA